MDGGGKSEFLLTGKFLLAVLWRPFAAFLLSAFFFSSPLLAQDWQGEYGIDGRYPNGQSYSGQVAVRPFGEGLGIFWKLEKGAGAYKGVGVAENNLLAVAYGQHSGFGVILYKIEGGKLTGRWFSSQDPSKKLNREILSGPADLNGTFHIEEGTNSSGEAYQGQVDIKQEGEIYLLHWKTPQPSFLGVGLRQGNYLAVAYGLKPDFGLAFYERTDEGAKGKWIGIGQRQSGKEIWGPPPVQ